MTIGQEISVEIEEYDHYLFEFHKIKIFINIDRVSFLFIYKV